MSDEEHPFGYAVGEMDTEAFLNMRDWLETALVKAGAKQIGKGIGAGESDVAIYLHGAPFNVSIRPLPMNLIPDGEANKGTT